MLRVIHIMGMHVPMYSVMLFLGIVAFFATYLLLVEKGEKIGRFTSNRVLAVSIAGIVVLGISAYIFDAIFHSIEQKKLVAGGITWLGGVVGAVPFMLFALHKFVPKVKGNALNFFSLLLPGLVLAHGLGRLGCFCAGCCYGKVTDSVFGVRFPEGSTAAKLYPGVDGRSLPVLPTQLFEAVFEFVLFAVMMILYAKKRKYYNLEIYLYSYGVFRFIMEFMRGDDRGSTGLFLSPAQVICLLLLVAATLLVLYRNGIVFKKLYRKCEEWRKEADALPEIPPEKKEKKRDSVGTIKELYELKERGAITEQEYEKKKAELLKRI